MSTPGSFSDTVKQQADIVRIIGDYVRLKKSGAQNFSGLCPFHQEKTPSFSVHATRQFYHCFGCGVSGDVFSFVQKIENVTFPEAVRAVAQKLGIALPKQQFDSPAEAREAKLRGVLLDMHERACAFFQEQLRRPEAARAREYLQQRGLTDETIRGFRIGYAPDSGFVLRDALRRDFAMEAMRESGLFSWKQPQESAHRPIGSSADLGTAKASSDQPISGSADHPINRSSDAAIYSKFRDRILFPIANESGRVIAFTGRRLSADDKAGPKYLNSPETAIYSKSRVLFNLDRAKDSIRKLDYTIVVEGQMDCISVYSAGFHNVVASSGTAFTELQARLLGRFSKNVVVNFDPDTAGAAATERTLTLLVAEEFNIKVLRLEQGLDPDLFIRQRGREGYAAALSGSHKYFDFLIERARAQFPPRSPESKAKALNYLLPHIQRVPSRVVRAELAADISQKLGIDDAVLRQELRHAATQRTPSVKTPAVAPLTDAERIIIRALAPGPGGADTLVGELRRRAADALAGEHLHEGLASESLIQALLEGRAGESPASTRSELDPAEADPAGGGEATQSGGALTDSSRALLASILMHEEEELTLELLEHAFDALRRRRLERRQRELRAQISEAERRQDPTLGQLVQEKLQIDRTLSAGSSN